MGQWRLLHQFRIMLHLGYQYVLQYDTDSHILSPIRFNLVNFMASENKVMAVKKVFSDKTSVGWARGVVIMSSIGVCVSL